MTAQYTGPSRRVSDTLPGNGVGIYTTEHERLDWLPHGSEVQRIAHEYQGTMEIWIRHRDIPNTLGEIPQIRKRYVYDSHAIPILVGWIPKWKGMTDAQAKARASFRGGTLALTGGDLPT